MDFQKLLALILLMLLAAPAMSQPLRVVGSDFPPYSYIENKQATGVVTTGVLDLLREAGLAADVEIYPWPRAYAQARQHSNILLFPIARTAERENDFEWLGTIVDYEVALWRRVERTDISLHNIESAGVWHVGGIASDVKTKLLQVHGVEVSLLVSEEIAIGMLSRGRIDLMAADTASLRYRARRQGIDPRDFVVALPLPEVSKPLYIALSKGSDPVIAAKLREALLTAVRTN